MKKVAFWQISLGYFLGAASVVLLVLYFMSTGTPFRTMAIKYGFEEGTGIVFTDRFVVVYDGMEGNNTGAGRINYAGKDGTLPAFWRGFALGWQGGPTGIETMSTYDPAFGTAPAAGPVVSAATFAEAEKLAQVTMTPAEREVAAASWRKSMAPLFERRVGPRKVSLDPDIAPATRWNPVLGGQTSGPTRDAFVRSTGGMRPLPASDADIAFSPVTQLSRWIEQKKLSS